MCCKTDGRYTPVPGEVYTVDGMQYTLTGLRAHTNYRIELRAFNTFGASDPLRLNVRTHGTLTQYSRQVYEYCMFDGSSRVAECS